MSAHAFIISSSAIESQSAAQARQISAQTAHVRLWKGEPRSMKFADISQMSAQSCRSRM
jgi:hypothetical protein